MVMGDLVSNMESIMINYLDVEVQPEDVVFSNDGILPEIKFSERVHEAIDEKLANSVAIHLLGKKIGYKALLNRIKTLWNPLGAINLIDLDSDYYLVRFTLEDDFHHVLSEGSWVIYGSYLTVQPCSRNFSTAVDHPLKIMVIVGAISEVVRIDYNTDDGKLGRFARLAIVVNLEKPLTSGIIIDGLRQPFEYEGLSLICYGYGKYGHIKEQCGKSSVEKSDNAQSSRGMENPEDLCAPWMQVTNNKKKMTLIKKDGKAGTRGTKNLANFGSRYEILEVEQTVETNKYPSKLKTMEMEVHGNGNANKLDKVITMRSNHAESSKQGKMQRQAKIANETNRNGSLAFGNLTNNTVVASKGKVHHVDSSLNRDKHVAVQFASHQTDVNSDDSIQWRVNFIFDRTDDAEMQGALNPDINRYFKLLVKSQRPDILALFELRISGIAADKFIRKSGFDYSNRVEARCYSGVILNDKEALKDVLVFALLSIVEELITFARVVILTLGVSTPISRISWQACGPTTEASSMILLNSKVKVESGTWTCLGTLEEANPCFLREFEEESLGIRSPKATGFKKNSFTTGGGSRNHSGNAYNFSKCSSNDLRDMLRDVSYDEVKAVVFGMDPLKAPGIDGLHAAFFQKNWNVVGGSVFRFVMKFFDDRILDDWANKIVESGHRISVEKTKVYFSKSCAIVTRSTITRDPGFEEVSDLKRSNNSCKTVLEAIPMYVMQSIWLPKGLCDEMKNVIRRFVWGSNDGSGGLYAGIMQKPIDVGGRGEIELEMYLEADDSAKGSNFFMASSSQSSTHKCRKDQAPYVYHEWVLNMLDQEFVSVATLAVDLDKISPVNHLKWRRPKCGWIKANSGKCSILIAELWAIHDILNHAWRLGFRHVELETDNLEASKICNKSSKALADNSLVAAISDLWDRDWTIKVRHIPREQNVATDRLAALSRGDSIGGHVFVEPPFELLSILQDDTAVSSEY
ncbi:hypothetical protein F3Y22_tig00020138pilonHSYRG00048 [Hibiscus syriacus]|uniref:DUF4283 domain-containing protein n=1 Tax=Hibiscus syriacus TaxID=106335 RepID=A0A6A3BUP0_HIBSY|nr:hypothetical protein F3Y22_tig00020138pilonHSYRG00048 [Hibiscus syriacus]